MTTDTLATITERIEDFSRLPNGVDYLRDALMSAAFAGKLVPQQISDVSVDVLLEQLSAEREPLKQRRRQRSGDTVSRQWELPATWRWVRLGDCASRIEYGYTASAEPFGEGPQMVRITDLKADGIDWSMVPFCTIDAKKEARYQLEPGDLLFARTGGTVGKSHLYLDDRRAVFASYLIRLRALPAMNVDYLALWLKSPDYWRQIYAGVNGTGQPNFNGAKLANLVVPLPPRSEQDAIVVVLSDLLDRIDSVENALAIEEQCRRQFGRAALRELSRRRDCLALDHLHALIRTMSDVQQLEAALLELAVMGHLTEADPSDEPIESLLAQVRMSSLDAPELLNDRERALVVHFKLRNGWRWVPMGCVLSNIQAGWSPSAQARPAENDEWGVLKVSACSWGEFRASENKALQSGQTPKPELEVKPGDFLISRANTSELVARSVIVDRTPPRLMLSDKTLRLSVVDGCNPRYLNLANLASVARSHYEQEANGTSSSMKNVSQRVIRRTPIPLPPRQEQDRIVAIVDELMGLLRRLRVEMAA